MPASARRGPCGANTLTSTPAPEPARPTPIPEVGKGLGITRWVDQSGRIGLGGFKYHVGRWLAGEMVEIVAHEGCSTSPTGASWWPPRPSASAPASRPPSDLPPRCASPARRPRA